MTDAAYSDREAFAIGSETDVDRNFMALTGLEENYVRGFGDSAMIISERMKAVGNDHLFFPACFLFRQYVELQCKYLLKTAWCLNNTTPFILRKTHTLGPLWQDVRKAIQPLLSEVNSIPFDSVESIIKQLESADLTGQELRYPSTSTGHVSLQAIPARISVEKLVSAIERARSFLDQWSLELAMMMET